MTNRLLLALSLAMSTTAAAQDALTYFGDMDGSQQAPTKKPEIVTFGGEMMIFDYDPTDDDVRWWREGTYTWEVLDGNSTTWGRVNGYVGSDGIEAIVFGNVLHLFYTESSSSTTTGYKIRHAMFNGYIWVFETLDGSGGTNGRTSNSVGGKPSAAVLSSTLWVSYRDHTGADIRVGSFDGTNWYFSVLDGAGGSSGQTSDMCAGPLSMGVGTEIWFFYVCQESGGHVNLRHAWSVPGGWNFAIRDGQSGMGTTESMSNATIQGTIYSYSPHIFYESYESNATHTTLRHAWKDLSGWHYEAVDGHSSSGGATTNDVGVAAVAVQNSKMHLYYMDYTSGNLRHAWGTGSSWTYETADGHTNNDQTGQVNDYVGLHPATMDYDYALVVYEGSDTVRSGVGPPP